MALPFEFVVEGPPVSQQARRRSRLHAWKDEVRREATARWPPGDLPTTASVQLSITYFYDSVSMDIDNIPKPISDALNALVYIDDEQITDSVIRKRNLNNDLRVDNQSPLLAAALSRQNEFLYIVGEEAPDQTVIT